MTPARQRATRRAAAIRAVYEQVRAPEWAAENLDGLADVLRDLSWLPVGEVSLARPADPDVAAVVLRCASEVAGGPRPIAVK